MNIDMSESPWKYLVQDTDKKEKIKRLEQEKLFHYKKIKSLNKQLQRLKEA